MIKADAEGKIKGKFKIPENIPAGSKRVGFLGTAHTGSAVFVGQGSLTVETLRQVNTVTTYFYDPIAQSFVLDQDVPLCGVDLYFCAKGENPNVRVQLRGMDNGYPSRTILAEAQVPDEDIVISGSGHTRVLFPTLFYGQADTEYALVILCDDPITALSVAELGQFDQFKQEAVTSQPYTVGVLFSSSNASTWTAHQTKDLSFRLLAADFLNKKTELDLGSAPVYGSTDLMLYSLAEMPSSSTRVEYEMTLPDGNSYRVAEGQPVRLNKASTGQVDVKAFLLGDEKKSPLLWPGSQLVSGAVELEADYITRAVQAYGGNRVKLIFDAFIPSGASIKAQLRLNQEDWQDMSLENTRVGDDGFYEYSYSLDPIEADTVQAKLILTGTAVNRPEACNVRVIVRG